MADYWKSTPKYWCKFCSVFVRDTPLERSNHESTARHKNAVRINLRELHRANEREERDKERTRRELERLNGLLSTGGDGQERRQQVEHQQGARRCANHADGATATRAERQRQLEQLVMMGVAIPEELRGVTAMAGEWVVTSTRVIAEGTTVTTTERGQEDDEDGKKGADGNNGVVWGGRKNKRDRKQTDEEREVEEAMSGLTKTKKPRRWGRDTGEDDELDALLAGPLPKKEASEGRDALVKEEVTGDDSARGEATVKLESHQDGNGVSAGTLASKLEVAPCSAGQDASDIGSLFKKRKRNNARSK